MSLKCRVTVPDAQSQAMLSMSANAKPDQLPPMTLPTFFKTTAAFRTWLQTNASSQPELLVGFWKVGCGKPSMSWPQSVDEALCFGWIDGVRKRIDDESYSIRFTPRKSTSIWSAVNIAKVDALRRDGRMTAAGEAAFAQRKEIKSAIYAYEQAEVAALSAEELRVFQQQQGAWKFFEATPPSYKKVILHWIATAKKAETRASRLHTLIDACVAGVRLR